LGALCLALLCPSAAFAQNPQVLPEIQVISTSEIKVSVLIAADYTELAVRALHTAYGLDAAG